MSEGGDLIKLDIETGRPNGIETKSRRTAKLVSKLQQMSNNEIDDLRQNLAKLAQQGKISNGFSNMLT